jgi:hypothetical protein
MALEMSVSDTLARCLASTYILGRIFSIVWFGLTKVSPAAAGRNLWVDPSKYPRKYPKYHVRQWAICSFVAIVTW